ncbi:MAG: hypothetical protein M3383_08690 [Actinomycetota bacterium]|nr:hypothetical protein [Actinomycetota bacterium]
MTERRRAEDGFTVVEALIATFVLLAGLLSIIGVFDDSRDQNATGERSEVALLQAEQALEELRGIPYNRLLLDAGAVDPGADRITSAGTRFQVKPGLSEPLVYYSSEGVPQANAWVAPTSAASIGLQAVPLEMTIHRFVTWRDEECRVADLGGLGLDIPGAVNRVQAPLDSLLAGILQAVLGPTELTALKNRLSKLQSALANREGALSTAVGGISELDLCDINASSLGVLRLLPNLDATGGVTDKLNALQAELDGLLCTLGICVLSTSDQAAITAVQNQLNCTFGAGADTQGEFESFINNVIGVLNNLAADVGDTEKNSKRITVAVVVEPRQGVGPMEPVWASSVVRDPSAGILTTCGGS